MENKQKLNRHLSQLDVFSLAIGSIIGWGAFVMPGDLFLPTAGPLGTVIAIAIAVVIMSIISLSYGYMVNKFPVAGGEFAFSFIGFNRIHAFICSWFLGLSYLAIVPLNATALGMIGRFMFPGVIQKGYLYSIAGWEVYLGEVLLASFVMILFAYLSIKGVGVSGKLQTYLSLFLILSILILIIATLFEPSIDFNNLKPAFPNEGSNLAGVLSIVAIAPWAFVGFDAIPQVAEEFNFSATKTLRLIILSITVGGLVYITMNTITALVMPWQDHLAMDVLWETGNAVELLLGNFGIILLAIALTSAILAGIMGFYTSASRLIFSMARANALPKKFAEITEDSKTPKNAILFVMVFSLIAPWFGREVLLWIVDMASIGAAIGYFYTCASAYIVCRRSDNTQSTKIFALVGAGLSLIFALLLLIPHSPAFLSRPSRIALVIWIILGIIFYYISRDNYHELSQKELSRRILGKD